MSDKGLADKLVGLGVGKASQIYPDGLGRFYQVDPDADWQTSVSAEKFVRDWRVAGECLERWPGDLQETMPKSLVWALREPRAICEAFVKLNDKGDT